MLELEKAENKDIYDELTAEVFITRQHYSRATYAKGCRGPLCRMAERDRGRKRSEKKAQDKGREYNPNEEIRKADRDALLWFIIEWHLNHPDEVQRRLEARTA
jgi:hypothetical protein